IVRQKLLEGLARLGDAAEARARLRPLRRGERRLVHGFAAADAEEYPARCEERDGRRRLRDDGWVVAERGRDDARAQPGAGRSCRDRAEPRECEGSVAPGVAPRMEVVA